jgi:hypothetical protein
MLTTYGTAYVARMMVGQDTPPLNLWLALTTAVPNLTDTGDTLAEPAAADYYRFELGIGTFWTQPVTGQDTAYYLWSIDYFPVTTWGTILGFALCEASVSGNVISVDEVTSPITMGAGQQITIESSSLRIRAY